MDIAGNDRADAEARKAATVGSSSRHKLPAPLRKTLPWSKSATRQLYHCKLKLAAMEIWTSSPRFNRIALIDPDLTHTKFAKLTNGLSHNQASLLFQLRLGHVLLQSYLHRIKKRTPRYAQTVISTEKPYYTSSCIAQPTLLQDKLCSTQPGGMQGTWEDSYQHRHCCPTYSCISEPQED